jgi:regulator of sirC expression with transglutaminase-like and TPR domain
MPANAITHAKPALSDAQRAALVQLLADDDPEVFRRIFDTILAQGPSARGWLEPHRLSDDACIRRRVSGVLDRLDRQEADRAFLAFCLSHGENLDLEEGCLLLARTTHAECNPAGYHAVLDAYSEEARIRLEGTDSPQSILVTLNRYLFHEVGFRGNSTDYYDPENNYLTCALDRRTANPITLSCVYLLISRRLTLPVVGVGLPGHFVCRYQTAASEIYIDAFNGGRLLTRADCIQHLNRFNFSVRDEYLSPVSPRRMLMRMLNNLLQVHQQRGDGEETERIRGYLLALARNASAGGLATV